MKNGHLSSYCPVTQAVDYCCNRQGSLPTSSCIFQCRSRKRKAWVSKIAIFELLLIFYVFIFYKNRFGCFISLISTFYIRRNKKILLFPVSRPTQGQTNRLKKFSRILKAKYLFGPFHLFFSFTFYIFQPVYFHFMKSILQIYCFHEIKLECFINGYSTANHTEE